MLQGCPLQLENLVSPGGIEHRFGQGKILPPLINLTRIPASPSTRLWTRRRHSYICNLCKIFFSFLHTDYVRNCDSGRWQPSRRYLGGANWSKTFDDCRRDSGRSFHARCRTRCKRLSTHPFSTDWRNRRNIVDSLSACLYDGCYSKA